MACFRDLSRYSYQSEPERLRPLVTVGWLTEGRSFPTAVPEAEFLDALYRYAADPVALCRGFHRCDLCTPEEHERLIRCGASPRFGNGEIRVPGRKRDYAAPRLVVHYVAVHHYAPPAEFVESVSKHAQQLPALSEQERADLVELSEGDPRRVADEIRRAEAAARTVPGPLDVLGKETSSTPRSRRERRRVAPHEDRPRAAIPLVESAAGADVPAPVPEPAAADEGPPRPSRRRTLGYEAPARSGRR